MRIRYIPEQETFVLKQDFPAAVVGRGLLLIGLALLLGASFFRLQSANALSWIIVTGIAFLLGYAGHLFFRLFRGRYRLSILVGRELVVNKAGDVFRLPWAILDGMGIVMEEGRLRLFATIEGARKELLLETAQTIEAEAELGNRLSMVLTRCGFADGGGDSCYYQPLSTLPEGCVSGGAGLFFGLFRRGIGVALSVLLFILAALCLGSAFLVLWNGVHEQGAAGFSFLIPVVLLFLVGLIVLAFLFRFVPRLMGHSAIPGLRFCPEGVYCILRGYWHFLSHKGMGEIQALPSGFPGRYRILLEHGGWPVRFPPLRFSFSIVNARRQVVEGGASEVSVEEWIKSWLDHDE